MNEEQPHVDRRLERVQLETDRQVIVGNVTLPPEGYQSRFSDFLNREDIAFVPLVNVEITSLDSGMVTTRDFVAIGKTHIRCAFAIKDVS